MPKDVSTTDATTLEALLALLKALDQPALLASPAGRLCGVNTQVARLLGRSSKALQDRPLAEVVSDETDRLVHYLQLASGTTQGTLGTLTFVTQDGPVRYRCSGARVDVPVLDDMPLVLLTLEPPEEAGERFQVLNEQIERLHHEIRERRQAEAELLAIRDELEQRVGERTAELERANRELAQSNENLRQFASVASHDLNEPLRKIQVFGSMLREHLVDEDLLDDPEVVLLLERMEDAAGRMRTLIASLLELSRVSTEPSETSPVRLSDVLEQTLSDLEHRIEETGARIEAGTLPTVRADATQLGQVLQNLLSNALKFRREEVAPVVRVYTLDDCGEEPAHDGGPWVCLAVEDNGIGIDPALTEDIFQPFRRLHGRSAYEGTGIGLAICKQIAERHGGTIRAEPLPTSGTRFILTLPAADPD